MLVRAFILMIFMSVQRLIIVVAAKAFQAMTVIKLRDFLRARATAKITACQAKDLSPAKRKHRESDEA
jgi:hypothetical protein